MSATGMKTAVLALLAAGLLVGCGTPTTEKAMNAKFSKVDYDMASIEEGKTVGPHLERLTQKYIGLVHEYEDQLGNDEARRRLSDKAFELSPYCLSCTTMLDREAAKY